MMIGISAAFGTGYVTISSGLKNDATPRERPIISPSGIETITATLKPIAMRRIDARILIREYLVAEDGRNGADSLQRGRKAIGVQNQRRDLPDAEQAEAGEQRRQTRDERKHCNHDRNSSSLVSSIMRSISTTYF